MLHFSKLKILIIYFIIIFLSIFSFTNFINNEENFFLSKKVNLGLDLQGGSYLLLEVDSTPVIKQKLQNKLVILRKELKKDNIKYQNLKIENQSILFKISENDKDKFKEFFEKEDNPINVYFNKYKSHELEFFLKMILLEYHIQNMV